MEASRYHGGSHSTRYPELIGLGLAGVFQHAGESASDVLRVAAVAVKAGGFSAGCRAFQTLPLLTVFRSDRPLSTRPSQGRFLAARGVIVLIPEG
jgi:hypothetical protein